MELSRFHNENKYLGETLSNDIPPLSIGTFSVECINCGLASFLLEHGRTKHSCCHYGKLNSSVLNILRH